MMSCVIVVHKINVVKFSYLHHTVCFYVDSSAQDKTTDLAVKVWCERELVHSVLDTLLGTSYRYCNQLTLFAVASETTHSECVNRLDFCIADQ